MSPSEIYDPDLGIFLSRDPYPGSLDSLACQIEHGLYRISQSGDNLDEIGKAYRQSQQDLIPSGGGGASDDLADAIKARDVQEATNADNVPLVAVDSHGNYVEVPIPESFQYYDDLPSFRYAGLHQGRRTTKLERLTGRRIRDDVASPNSKGFPIFAKKQYGYYKANEWEYRMQTWELQDGTIVEDHFWRNRKTGDTWYHD